MSKSGQYDTFNTPYKPNLFSPLANFSPSWNTPGTGVSSYYPAPFSPIPSKHTVLATPRASGQSKRKSSGKENTSTTPVDHRKRGKKLPLTITDKIKLFHGFTKHDLGWTYSEALYYTSQATTDLDFTQTSLDDSDSRLSKWDTSRESITATARKSCPSKIDATPANW